MEKWDNTLSPSSLVPLSCVRTLDAMSRSLEFPRTVKVSLVGPLSYLHSTLLLSSFNLSLFSVLFCLHLKSLSGLFPKLSSFALQISKSQISFHILTIFSSSVCCKSELLSFLSSSAALSPVVRIWGSKMLLEAPFGWVWFFWGGEEAIIIPTHLKSYTLLCPD